MTIHQSNLDLRLDKINGIKIRKILSEELNIPYTFIVGEGEEEKAIAILKDIITNLKKNKINTDIPDSHITTAWT